MPNSICEKLRAMATQFFQKLYGLLAFAGTNRRRSLNLSFSLLCSAVPSALLLSRYATLPIIPYVCLLLGNLIFWSALNFIFLCMIFFIFERRPYNQIHFQRLGIKDVREFPLKWARAYWVQAILAFLIYPAQEGEVLWITALLAISWTFVMFEAACSFYKIVGEAKLSGRTIRVPSPEDFEQEMEVDRFFSTQFNILGSYRKFKKKIGNEVRNAILMEGNEIICRFDQPASISEIQIGIATPGRSRRGEITASFEDVTVLKKPLSILPAGWSDFINFQRRPGESLVSKIKITSGGGAKAIISLRRAKRSLKPRNIILIVIDGLRKDAIGLYDGGRGKTPAIDNFFRNYTHYKNAYAQGEWTPSAFACIATSLYPSHHRMTDSDYQNLKSLPRDVETMAEALQGGGFHTIGFFSAARVSHLFGHHRGYDRFFSPSGRAGAREVTAVAMDVLHAQPEENKFILLHYMDVRSPIKITSPFSWDGLSLMTERDIDIQERAERGLSPENAHFYSDLYANKVSELDFALSNLFSYIERHDQKDETAVILTADHGLNMPTDGVPMWFKKLFSAERLNIPLLIRCPWREDTHGMVYDQLVEGNIDLYPTIMELAGLEGKHSSFSRSFLPPEKGTYKGKDFVVSEMFFKNEYGCRIWDGKRQYIRRISMNDMTLISETLSSPEKGQLNSDSDCDPSALSQYRSLTVGLNLVQPKQNDFTPMASAPTA